MGPGADNFDVEQQRSASERATCWHAYFDCVSIGRFRRRRASLHVECQRSPSSPRSSSPPQLMPLAHPRATPHAHKQKDSPLTSQRPLPCVIIPGRCARFHSCGKELQIDALSDQLSMERVLTLQHGTTPLIIEKGRSVEVQMQQDDGEYHAECGFEYFGFDQQNDRYRALKSDKKSPAQFRGALS